MDNVDPIIILIYAAGATAGILAAAALAVWAGTSLDNRRSKP